MLKGSNRLVELCKWMLATTRRRAMGNISDCIDYRLHTCVNHESKYQNFQKFLQKIKRMELSLA